MNNIFFNGCSYTYGIGASEVRSEIDDLRYSRWLCNAMGMEDVNIAKQGSCNDRIARTTYAHLLDPNTVKPKLGIIMWSDPHRTEIENISEFVNSGVDLRQVTPQGVGEIQSQALREGLKYYFSFIATRRRQLLYTIHHMVSIQNLFDSLNIPLIQFHYKSTINRLYRHSMLDVDHYEDVPCVSLQGSYIINSLKYLERNEHCFGFSRNLSFDDLIQKEEIPHSTICLGHPSVDAYKMMAEWFHDYIDTTKIITY